MPYEIETMDLPEQTALIKRGTMPAEAISTWLPQAYMELFTYLGEQRIDPDGPPFARYILDGAAGGESGGEITVEGGVPVAVPVAGEGELVMSALPAGKVVTTVHVGRYQDMAGPYEALQAWITDSHKEPTGVYWEIYLTDPAKTTDPALHQTMLFMGYR